MGSTFVEKVLALKSGKDKVICNVYDDGNNVIAHRIFKLEQYAQVNVKQVSDDATAADNLELACDNYSATRGLSGTALPAAAADAAGGLPISDAGGLDLDAMNTNVNDIETDTNEIQSKLPTNNIMGSSVTTDKDDEIDAIKAVTDNLPNSGALTDIDTGINNLETRIPDTISLANINGEVDTALSDIHLDHLLAATYDPATKPGVADALLNELIENDAGVSRYTANALEQAPTDGTPLTSQEVRDAMKLAPTGGAPAAGSVDEHLDDVLADTNEIQGKLPDNNIMGSSVTTDKDDEIDAIKAKTDNLPEAIKKNTAVTDFPFSLVLSSDDVSPATGVSVTTNSQFARRPKRR